VSTNQADSRANQDAIEVAIPTNAAVSSIAQWITYPAVELCRCCFGTATASDACGACHGRTVMSGRRTVQVQLPPGLRDGQLLILPGLVDHYPDRQDDLCMRIRLLPPAPDELWWATKGASRRSPAGSGLPRVLAGPFETNFPDRRLLSCRLVGGYGHNLRPDLPYTLSVGQRAFAMTTEHSRQDVVGDGVTSVPCRRCLSALPARSRFGSSPTFKSGALAPSPGAVVSLAAATALKQRPSAS
jgi:hypothetical protein